MREEFPFRHYVSHAVLGLVVGRKPHTRTRKNGNEILVDTVVFVSVRFLEMRRLASHHRLAHSVSIAAPGGVDDSRLKTRKTEENRNGPTKMR